MLRDTRIDVALYDMKVPDLRWHLILGDIVEGTVISRDWDRQALLQSVLLPGATAVRLTDGHPEAAGVFSHCVGRPPGPASSPTMGRGLRDTTSVLAHGKSGDLE
jgi:hypothetical protein